VGVGPLAGAGAADGAGDDAAAATPAPERPQPVQPDLAGDADTPLAAEGAVVDAICSLPWPCAEALSVARCESTLQPWATNGDHYGLFQIRASLHAWRWPDFWTAWSEPVRASQMAFDLFMEQGWRPWSCRP